MLDKTQVEGGHQRRRGSKTKFWPALAVSLKNRLHRSTAPPPLRQPLVPEVEPLKLQGLAWLVWPLSGAFLPLHIDTRVH